MFELETEMSKWKQSLLADGSVVPEEAMELEEHLRESIMNLRSAGLSQREAFIIGADRLGNPSELGQEYVKVNFKARWQRPVFWMLAGYIGMEVVGSVVSVVVTIAGTALAFGGAGATAASTVMISLMLMAWIGLAALAYRHLESLGNCADRLPTKWLCVAGIMLIAAPILVSAGQINQWRIVGQFWFTETAVYLMYGRWVIQGLVVAFCFAAMCKFGAAAKRARVENI